ncbi:MAG: IPT/TIG domain-containing protein [Deltaproteobacteria bacterium]
MKRLLVLSLVAAAACSRPEGGSDAGGQPTFIPTTPRDGGTTGGLDGGPRADAGPIVLDGGGPVPVVVAQVSPNRGPIAGGTPVTISGSGFASGLLSGASAAGPLTQVSFDGNPAIGLTVLTDGTLELSSPPGLVGPADVTVSNPNGSATCHGCFLYQAPVEVFSVSPARGPIAGGTSVVVSGVGFDPDTVLVFGPRGAIHTTFVSSTTLVGLTPPAPLAGPVDVRAFNRSGYGKLHGGFSYFAKPVVTSAAPAGGPSSGGTAVTITGHGFLGETLAASVGGTPASQVTVVDDQTATLVTPPGPAGPAEVTVSDPDGTGALPSGFVYYPASATGLALDGIAPASGSAAGGTAVTLVGSGFAGTPVVTFAGVAATQVTLLDPHRIAALTPPGASGAVDVTISIGGATATLAQAFTYEPALSISLLAPGSGPTSGGTQVTVTGVGFAQGDRVFLGALEAAQVTVANATSLSFATPPGTAGPADLTVVSAANPALTATLPGAFSYSDSFSLIQLAPASGAQAGGTYVTLLGTGFTLGVAATFGGAPATQVTWVDPYTVSCHTPPGSPGSVDVTAQLPAQGGANGPTSTLAGGFSYFDPTNAVGGESGGPLDGTLNVTVLDSDPSASGQPLQGATVQLGVDPRSPFQGQTDAQGQITFSDPTLVKAQTVTVTYGGFVAATVDGVASQNLTVFLDVPMGSGSMPQPCPCGAPPDCPTNCGLPFCGMLGSCVQCLQDSDCQNPSLPGYDPTKPHCNPPGGIGGMCVQCTKDADCANNPQGLLACDDARGAQSSYSCVQCTGSQFCPQGEYCNGNSLTCVQPDVISGSVYGFKLPTLVTLTASQHLEAHVGLVQPAVYAFEPFGPQPQEVVVTQDGGKFSLALDAGPLTLSLYAKFGIHDSATGLFTPLLLGVLRGIYVAPSQPVTNASLILDTHLDQSATIDLANLLSAPPPLTPTAPDPNPVHYDTFSYLDLGQAGILPLEDTDGTTSPQTLAHLPNVASGDVLFLTQAYQPVASGQTAPADPSQRTPESLFFRRTSGGFGSAVTLGPLLSFAAPTHPGFGAQLDGTFSWSFVDSTAPTPDLTKIDLYWTQIDATGTQQAPLTQLWEIVVPGSQTTVQIPPAQLTQLEQGLPQSSSSSTTILAWFLYTARSPRFDYDFWSYQELSELTWTSFQSSYSIAFP